MLSAYMPHGASNEIKSFTLWEDLFKRIGDISHNNVMVLGDFNAAIRARMAGEEECLGPHIWGKGLVFLREGRLASRKHEQESFHRLIMT